jgi:hypothetical protein
LEELPQKSDPKDYRSTPNVTITWVENCSGKTKIRDQELISDENAHSTGFGKGVSPRHTYWPDSASVTLFHFFFVNFDRHFSSVRKTSNSYRPEVKTATVWRKQRNPRRLFFSGLKDEIRNCLFQSKSTN